MRPAGLHVREIRNIAELIAAVADAPELLASEPLWFRGQRVASWSLAPGVHRQSEALGLDGESYEQDVSNRFKNRAGVYGPGYHANERPSWLQIMQHHGLPTRLLDWTRSPLVAAYFALEAVLTSAKNGVDPENDCAIWILAPHTLNPIATDYQHNVTPSIESLICRGLVDGAFWGDEWASKQAARREQELAVEDGTHNRDASGRYVGPSCMAVMANEMDLRMLVQQGAFTVHATGSPPLDEDPRFASCLMLLRVPKENAVAMARELKICGFDESGIYPDLDHLASELRRTSLL